MVTEVYKCDVCSKEHGTWKEAAECAMRAYPNGRFGVGDVVSYEVRTANGAFRLGAVVCDTVLSDSCTMAATLVIAIRDCRTVRHMDKTWSGEVHDLSTVRCEGGDEIINKMTLYRAILKLRKQKPQSEKESIERLRKLMVLYSLQDGDTKTALEHAPTYDLMS